MASYTTRRIQRVKDNSSSTSSDSSSSSASSFGLRTPEFGGVVDPHLTNLDFGQARAFNSLSLDDKKETYSHPPPFELPAPPPLSLPRAFLRPRPAPPPPVASQPSSESDETWTDLSTTPRPCTPLDLLDSTPKPSSPIAEAVAIPPPPRPTTNPQRRRRGRSITLHILWRSTLSDEARLVLKDFYEWKTGYEWPDLNGEGMELWSAKVEAVGL